MDPNERKTLRKILHVDMDAFFVEVELLKRPEFKGKPVIVGGKSPRGVVTTCSYEARKFGIHSAMPSIQAQRLCPSAIWLESDYASYSEYSRKVFEILRRFSPEVVQLSIDEGRIDLTGSELLFGPAPLIADTILKSIRDELKLPASGGLSNSGSAAKIAAELAKPNGLAVMLPGYERMFLSPLKIERIPGIGKKSAPRFHSLGYRTIGDLAKTSPSELSRNFGRFGSELNKIARGYPGEIYHRESESPSRSHERTYMTDLTDPEIIKTEIRSLVEKLGFKLRQEHLKARTITVKIRDGRFQTITRSFSFDRPIDSDRIFFQTALELVMQNRPHNAGIRLIGVAGHQLSSTTSQLDLFAESETKTDSFYSTVDSIKNRFGAQSVRFGR